MTRSAELVILSAAKDLHSIKVEFVLCEIPRYAQNDKQRVGAIHESPVNFDVISRVDESINPYNLIC